MAKIFTLDISDNNREILVAIQCPFPAYRLVARVNEALKINFARVKNLEWEEELAKHEFSLFLYKQKNNQCWFLIANKQKIQQNEPQGLFAKIQRVNYLIQELTHVDYFLLITQPMDDFSEHTLVKNLREISCISSAHLVDKNKLKSKHKLFF